MKIQFRRMTGDDIDAVYQIEKSVFSSPWTKQGFLSEIENDRYSHPFVAVDQDGIAGYVIGWQVAGELHIGNIAVLPAKQGQGIGRYLLSNLIARFQNVELFYLEVREHNSRAISMYESFGFAPLLKRKAYYPDGEDAVIMIKSKQNGKNNGLVQKKKRSSETC